MNIISSLELKELINVNPQIKQIIVAKNMKQKDVAEKIGVTSQQLSNWINKVSYPRLEKAFELAKVLEVKVDDLYKED